MSACDFDYHSTAFSYHIDYCTDRAFIGRDKFIQTGPAGTEAKTDRNTTAVSEMDNEYHRRFSGIAEHLVAANGG